MVTNIAKLKSGKGAPPPVDTTPDMIAENTRKEKVELKPIQVRVTKEIFVEFSEQAGKECGFSHGAKKRLFLKMWKAYKAQNM